jgi:peptidoglycan/xylan/chitin deacetylase (PgdA/CDA1 family)
MRNKLLLLLTMMVLASSQCLAQDKQIALTFDKLPYMEPMGFWTPRELSNLMLRALEAEKAPALGFVVEEKVDDLPESYIVLSDWVGHGQSLGNLTYGYVDLNELNTKDFLAHIADGQKYLRRALRMVRPIRRYFRFPQLHEGNTPSKKHDVASRLQRAGFIIVPATVIMTDYEFNFYYADAAASDESLARLKEFYLESLGDALDYAEQQSDLVFERNIAQILRLHLGVATANLMPEVLRFLKERGYSFITVDRALEDPAYQTEEDYVGPLGLSFIDRVAATRGLPFKEDAGEISRRSIGERLGLN